MANMQVIVYKMYMRNNSFSLYFIFFIFCLSNSLACTAVENSYTYKLDYSLVESMNKLDFALSYKSQIKHQKMLPFPYETEWSKGNLKKQLMSMKKQEDIDSISYVLNWDRSVVLKKGKDKRKHYPISVSYTHLTLPTTPYV